LKQTGSLIVRDEEEEAEENLNTYLELLGDG
jgi:chaperonin cofactor prefoldin